MHGFSWLPSPPRPGGVFVPGEPDTVAGAWAWRLGFDAAPQDNGHVGEMSDVFRSDLESNLPCLAHDNDDASRSSKVLVEHFAAD